MKAWTLPLTLAGFFLVAAGFAWWLPEQPASTLELPAPEGSVAERKKAFVQALLPHIRAQNDQISEWRERIKDAHESLRKGRELDAKEQEWLYSVARRHRLPPPETLNADWTRRLLRRVDIIPADLALAQAAIESAWGKSRFARQGNNYFGQWCFEAGCGLVPRRRPEGATHEVQVFDSPEGSVETYMRNLNSHPAYTRLRHIRAELRRQGRPLTGEALAAGLDKYSALGDTYGQRLRALIEHNELERFRHNDRTS